MKTIKPPLPLCGLCHQPALVGGWITVAPRKKRWGCARCAGTTRAHPFVHESEPRLL